MKKNIIIDSDYYKQSHWLQIPNTLTKQYSYGESRIGSHYPFISYFGMNMIVKDHFLQKITNEMIDEAEEENQLTGRKEYFNREVWEKVKKLGYLPIEIKSAPEGRKIPINNVLFTLESTEPWFARTAQSLETELMNFWYPTTIATRSMYIKEAIKPLVEQTGSIELLPYMVNDFGARGATGYEAAYRGGAGHLVHFEGSDNMMASRAIKEYYGYKGRAKSVWATEHSIALFFGPGEGEYNYVNYQLDNSPDDAIISIVVDTYNADNFLINVITREDILNKIKNRVGRTVFRLDSGEPQYSVEKGLELLTPTFNFTINKKGVGYKVLDYNVGLLQGDGMTENSIPELYQSIIKNRWSTDNLVTGSGGGLLQVDVNRDTQRIAIKPSYGEKEGVGFNMQKKPITDLSKSSKSGKLKLHESMKNSFQTISSANETSQQFNAYNDSLKTLYKNGEYFPIKFEDVLENASM